MYCWDDGDHFFPAWSYAYTYWGIFSDYTAEEPIIDAVTVPTNVDGEGFDMTYIGYMLNEGTSTVDCTITPSNAACAILSE